jgi:UDP-N-acetylglucosamine transferase subunit ALG13
LRICLAGSGGGHLFELLDLEPAWSSYDFFFVTEDTPLGRSVAQSYPCHFVSHVAFGQGRLGKPATMAAAAVLNFFQSAAIVVRRRPQVVITTGAGSAFFLLLWSRLIGARIVAIETLARFDRPSAFARIAFPFAHETVVQSQALARFWPTAAVFDPLRLVEGPRPSKQPLLFATVGATLTFDRLVAMVVAVKAGGHIPERVLIQTGPGHGPALTDIDCVESLAFDDMVNRLREADLVVCHGGVGSLISALREGCRVVAVPRQFELAEHYDNHQAEITHAFAARGLINVANTVEELAAALDAARARPPIAVTSDPAALIEHLKKLLRMWT